MCGAGSHGTSERPSATPQDAVWNAPLRIHTDVVCLAASSRRSSAAYRVRRSSDLVDRMAYSSRGRAPFRPSADVPRIPGMNPAPRA